MRWGSGGEEDDNDWYKVECCSMYEVSFVLELVLASRGGEGVRGMISFYFCSIYVIFSLYIFFTSL